MALSIAKRLWLKKEIGERCIDETKVTGAIKGLGEKFVPLPFYIL
jgi:hypothetical protein